ncbi:hypothetical protein Q9966_006117 [Columba livia]|nr:hypothetical protein Q9966_006117 [Columba livia]
MEVLTMIMASLAQKSKVALEFASSQDWMKPEHLKMTQVQELICSSGTKGLSKSPKPQVLLWMFCSHDWAMSRGSKQVVLSEVRGALCSMSSCQMEMHLPGLAGRRNLRDLQQLRSTWKCWELSVLKCLSASQVPHIANYGISALSFVGNPGDNTQRQQRCRHVGWK